MSKKDDDAIHVTDPKEVAEWRAFLDNPANQYHGPFVACVEHGMGSTDPGWACYLCEALATNPGCAKGCTAGTDAYLCTESPPGKDCPCKCHATGDLDVW